ncbi:MAG: polyketide cyclase / dehydrase and lipid transport [uncultured archaeon A07HR60]|nr:MAG: polyketide cyclase / dehydrase and lipid transport [uncultured archaeon A07HR60]
MRVPPVPYGVDRVVVRTYVYESPERVYEFLRNFTGYARYSGYLDSVRQTAGDGGTGTEYALAFSWWKLEYTVLSRVTDTDRPRQIDWQLIKDINAQGYWGIDPVADQTEVTDGFSPDFDAGEICEITFEVRFDPGSAGANIVDLPRFVSMGWVLDKLVPKIYEEATNVVERAVEDLEGSRRELEFDVTSTSDTL